MAFQELLSVTLWLQHSWWALSGAVLFCDGDRIEFLTFSAHSFEQLEFNSSSYLTHQASLLLISQDSGSVDAVLVGADRIANNGDTANKIGTFQVQQCLIVGWYC